MTTVLITSASAKLRLIDAFQRATQAIGGKTIAVDCDPECAAASFADIFIKIPRDNDAGYEKAILDICAKHNVSLIIPTRDEELSKLVDMSGGFEEKGIILPLTTLEKLDTILDKAAFHTFCETHNFPVLPRHKPNSTAPWPLFIRKRRSAGGKGAFVIQGYKEWLGSALDSEDVICQQVTSDNEYSIDVLMSLQGEPLQAVVRQRCVVDHGECVEGLIVDIPQLADMSLDLCKQLGLKGHNVVQAFCSQDGDIHFIEVNARFGGASIMSVEAGLNSPARLLQMIQPKNELTEEAVSMSDTLDITYGLRFIARPDNPTSYIREIV